MNYTGYFFNGAFGTSFIGAAPTLEELGGQTGYVVGEYSSDTHYYDGIVGAPMQKQALPIVVSGFAIAADGDDVVTVSGVPAEVYVSFNGAPPVEVVGGEVSFKTLDAGDHSMVFTSVKYLAREVEIAAS